MKDHPPEVKITRPGRDFKASPIEEVTVQVEAKDDFGLKNVELHYSVNGGPDTNVPMLQSKDGKTSTGTTPHKWLLQQRVQHARGLLERTQLGIEEVAHQAGFGTATLLRHHFSRMVGVSPTDYRRSFAA